MVGKKQSLFSRHWKLLLSVLCLFAVAGFSAPIASEDFYYAHGTVLSGGTATGGSGWTGGWNAATGDGVTVAGAQMDQSINAESTRGLAVPFTLNGSAVYYFGFIARADETGSFSFQLKQTSGDYVRWSVSRNSDGSITVNGAGASVTSDPGCFVGGREYLVVSKFETSGDIARVKLFDTSSPGDYTVEPAIWDLVADGSTGVTIDRLDLDVNTGRVAIDNIRIATTYAEVLPELNPLSTFVYEMDQPLTVATSEWTYAVEQAGDYQLGLAWVETLSGGDVALEIFKNGLERIKALYAQAGEVTRFEARIEDLYPGDEITVRLTPDGSTYRAGYQIAFSTPTFDGLPVFDVASYGAVGDGVTDDMAAMRAAVTDARNAGGGIVQLDGTKTYRSIGLADLTIETLFDLYGARDIKIEGNGATILLHPPDSLASLRYCENVQIDGLNIDYDPKPYYQGTITDINVTNLTIDIDVPERYPLPMVGTDSNSAPFFGRSFIPDFSGARSGRGENIYVESTALNGGPRKVRIQVPETANGVAMAPRVQDAYDNNATEFVVPHLLYGHRNGSTKIYGCSRVKLSNLHYVCMAHFWLTITQNTGPVTLSNVDLKMMEPETELLASWRDGMHIKNGRWGILIEAGDWDGAAQYDDTFAIYSRRQVVAAVSNNAAVLKPAVYNRESWLWEPGDWASFWSPDQETLRGMARVVSKRDLVSPEYEVIFESMPVGVSSNDVVLHEESLNRGTLVRNCTTGSVGTENASTRLRGTDMRFENNRFEDFSFRLEWSDGLGTPRARDVVVEDTYLSSPDGSLILARPLGVLFKNCVIDGLEAQVHAGADDILFDGVVWSNMTGDIFNIQSDSHVWLFGNSVRNGSAAGLATHVSVDAASNITYAPPADYPEPVPPGPSDFTHILSPDADSFIRDGEPDANYGSAAVLRCKMDAAGNYTRQPCLRFDLADVRGLIERAVLRLRLVSVNGRGDTHTAYFVEDDSWGETSITWSNRPAVGVPLAFAAPGEVGEWVEWDVTDQVAAECAGDRQISVVLISDGSVLAEYASRESVTNIPQLVVKSRWSYGAWSNQYQLVRGPEGDDDSDGVSNIDEYAFGGDPKDAEDSGIPPQFMLNDESAEFVYSQRTAADSGLRYTVESTDDLVSNVWKQAESAPGTFSNGWKTVTHVFPMVGKSQQFFRLEVDSL